MGVIAVALPFVIIVVGFVYVREFQNSISNMRSQVYDVMELVDAFSPEEYDEQEADEQSRLVVAGVLRQDLERLSSSVRWLVRGVFGVGAVAVAALVGAILL